jgi:hypothetical protein
MNFLKKIGTIYDITNLAALHQKPVSVSAASGVDEGDAARRGRIKVEPDLMVQLDWF